MLGFFKKKDPVCVVCHTKLLKVDVRDVPPPAKREFARLNRYAPLATGGWWLCTECNIHIHVPTVEAMNRYRK